MYLWVPHGVAETCLSLAATSINADCPSGNAPTTLVLCLAFEGEIPQSRLVAVCTLSGCAANSSTAAESMVSCRFCARSMMRECVGAWTGGARSARHAGVHRRTGVFEGDEREGQLTCSLKFLIRNLFS